MVPQGLGCDTTKVRDGRTYGTGTLHTLQYQSASICLQHSTVGLILRGTSSLRKVPVRYDTR